MGPIVDYLVAIALDEEYRYFREVVQRSTGRKISSKEIGSQVYGLARLPTGIAEASTVILTVGRMTPAAMQAAVERAVETWGPSAVVMVGIAGSLEPDKIKLGDVI